MADPLEAKEDFFLFAFRLMNQRALRLPGDLASVLREVSVRKAMERQVLDCSRQLFLRSGSIRRLDQCVAEVGGAGGEAALRAYLHDAQRELKLL